MKIGDKIKAFKFDKHGVYSFNEQMENLIGEVGTVRRVYEDTVSIVFEGVDGSFGYPLEMAENYLVNKTKDLFPIY